MELSYVTVTCGHNTISIYGMTSHCAEVNWWRFLTLFK